jgi:hypothetical protein
MFVENAVLNPLATNKLHYVSTLFLDFEIKCIHIYLNLPNYYDYVIVIVL